MKANNLREEIQIFHMGTSCYIFTYEVLLFSVQMSGIIQPEISNYFSVIRNIICKTLARHPVL